LDRQIPGTEIGILHLGRERRTISQHGQRASFQSQILLKLRTILSIAAAERDIVLVEQSIEDVYRKEYD